MASTCYLFCMRYRHEDHDTLHPSWGQSKNSKIQCSNNYELHSLTGCELLWTDWNKELHWLLYTTFPHHISQTVFIFHDFPDRTPFPWPTFPYFPFIGFFKHIHNCRDAYLQYGWPRNIPVQAETGRRLTWMCRESNKHQRQLLTTVPTKNTRLHGAAAVRYRWTNRARARWLLTVVGHFQQCHCIQDPRRCRLLSKY